VWTPDALRDAVAPFVEEFGPLAADHRARFGPHTVIRADGPHRWKVSQRLIPADPDVDLDDVNWTIDAVIDLTDDTNPSGPLVRLMEIGE
jgi:hypothetical protein